MKKYGIVIGKVFLLFFLYILIGATVPFLFQKEVSNKEVLDFPYKEYYGSEAGVDRARIVEENEDALTVRLEMFEAAKERIVLSYFDIREGDSTTDVFSSLLAAADRGVKVKLIVDGFSGMMNMRGRTIFEAAGSHENIEIRFYNTPSLIRPWTLNGRMHDKYIVVDHSLLLLGGRNQYDYFVGEYPNKGKGLEREVLIYCNREEAAQNAEVGWASTYGTKAGVIDEVEDYFVKMWDSPYMEKRFEKPDTESLDTQKELRDHYEYVKDKISNKSGEDWKNETIPIKKATFVTNPIHIGNKEPYVWHRLREIMVNARDEVQIQTPYAVFSEDMYDGMAEIAKKLPQTDMVINSLAVGDNVMAAFDYTFNKEKVLKTGLNVYEYFGDHSSHTKALLVDDDISVIGSYNLDMRSTYVDTETMLVIHGEEFNGLMRERVDKIKDDSLLVGEDGRHIPKNGVETVSLPKTRRALNRIGSVVIQLVRYLV